jgi:nucleoside phosphorylase
MTASSPAADARLPAPPVAIVGALSLEVAAARGVLRSRKTLWSGAPTFWVGLADPPPNPVAVAVDAPGVRSGPRTVIAGALGMGKAAVEAGLERLFKDFEPAAVAFVGLAGGCAAEARAADLYLPNPIRVEPELGPDGVPIAGREPIEPTRSVVEAILRAAATADQPIKSAGGMTINVLAATQRAKESLGRNRGIALCDMETFWAARFCKERGIPFGALRVIYDALEDPLPEVPGLGTTPLPLLLLRKPGLVTVLPKLALRLLKVRRVYDPVVRALVRELAAL